MKALVLLFVLSFLPAPAAAEELALLEGGRFPILTGASEAEARRVLMALEEMAQAMEAVFGPLSAAAPPARVYLIRDGAILRRLGTTAYGKGFFQSGPDFDIITVLAGEPGTIRSARHEYVHRFLHRSTRRLPPWLEEGLAEFYSVLFRDGDRWIGGSPIDAHLQYLRTVGWAPFDQLESAHQDATLWDRAAAVNLYYGQCWAFVHYLAAGSPRAGQFEALLRRLMDGEAAAEALRAEYGESPAGLLQAARVQVESGRLRTRAIAQARPPAPLAATRWNPLPPGESAAALAELAASRGDAVATGEWLDSLARAAQGSPRGSVRAAILALRRGDRGEAEHLLRSAVDAGVHEPAAWFELAMLVRDRDGATPEVQRLLEKTLELNPAHPEALYLLAMEEHRAGRSGRALQYLERSLAALPRQFVFREALARLYAELGRAAEARHQAVAARSSARTSDERAMADGLLRELELAARPAPAPGARKPEVTVPRGWLEPHRDGEVRGTLVHIDCGQTIVFDVDTGDGLRRFRANRSRLMISGRQQDTAFQCGPQASRPRVAARFQAPDLLVQLVFLDPEP
jgi:tetratricopeptide (TPR) repeat protein